MLEAELQENVIEAAHVYGWRVAHFRPAKTGKGWRTPVSADGKGFPDLVLVHEQKRRLLFIELKGSRGKLTDEQKLWVKWLGAIPGIVMAVWTPEDWYSDAITNALR